MMDRVPIHVPYEVYVQRHWINLLPLSSCVGWLEKGQEQEALLPTQNPKKGSRMTGVARQSHGANRFWNRAKSFRSIDMSSFMSNS